MIAVQVRTNTTRKTRNVDITSTPAQVFSDLEISPAGAMINLNGTILSATDLNSTFEALGVTDGTTCNLNSIVKMDGANK